MILLLLINTCLCAIPHNSTSTIVALIGAFTSPLVIFILPGYLFYNFASKNETDAKHRKLSLALAVVGFGLLIIMTTISFYVIRTMFFSVKITDADRF